MEASAQQTPNRCAARIPGADKIVEVVEEEPQQETQGWRTMREKLQTQEGREIYARRKVIVEPVFGHVK